MLILFESMKGLPILSVAVFVLSGCNGYFPLNPDNPIDTSSFGVTQKTSMILHLVLDLGSPTIMSFTQIVDI